MPLNNYSLSATSCQEFCLALKTAREQSGITLDEIAESTKIPASLFAELERNDLRHWPRGLFGRSFFRDYARMIGVPVTEACAEFVRLFLDEEPAEPATPVEVLTPSHQRLLDALAHGRAAMVAAWQRGAEVISQALRRTGNSTTEPAAEPAGEPDPNPWITDARRVNSDPPRIRVRIKLPR